MIADRLVILDHHPGRVKSELPIPLKHPRDRTAPAFRQLVERVYDLMIATTATQRVAGLGYRLPSVPAGQFLGVLEAIRHALSLIHI